MLQEHLRHEVVTSGANDVVLDVAHELGVCTQLFICSVSKKIVDTQVAKYKKSQTWVDLGRTVNPLKSWDVMQFGWFHNGWTQCEGCVTYKVSYGDAALGNASGRLDFGVDVAKMPMHLAISSTPSLSISLVADCTTP